MERLSAGISGVLSLGIIVAVVLGPLVSNTVRFHMNRNAIVQYQGSEVVMLAVAAGLLLAAWLWRSNSPLAASLALGLALFVIYTMVTVLMGQEFEQFPDGNAEKFFLLYIGITSLASMLAVLAINRLIGSPLDVNPRWTTITTWVLGVEAALFALLWIGQILGTYRNGMTSEVEETRLLFWLVKYLDLGFMIPVIFIALVLLHQQQPLGPVLVVGLAGFVTVMLVAIAAMTIALNVQGESGGSLPLAVGMVVLAIPSALVWWQWVNAAAKT